MSETKPKQLDPYEYDQDMDQYAKNLNVLRESSMGLALAQA